MEAYVLVVSGHVQGVGFRWFTEREALKRDVRGYVRNLADGRVEVIAQGEKETLLQFCERVRRGPPASRVEDVRIERVTVDDTLATFDVRF